MTDLLKQAYDPENFRGQAHRLVDLLADHLEASYSQSDKTVLPWMDPDQRLLKWQNDLEQKFEFEPFWKDTIDETIHIHHPKYLGHQVCASLPLAGLGDMLNGVLNNGSAIYEMGPVSTAMERVVIDWLAGAMGYGKEASGVLTSGGSLGNLTALLAARQHQSGYDHWTEGKIDGFHPAIMVSEESHYSVSRAVQIMGWGEKGVIKVPTNPLHQLDAGRLEETYAKAEKQGLKVLVLVGNAGSTSTGSYDPLDQIAHFSEKKGLWFHIDGAHGGAAAITPKYRHLTKGIERADSIVIDFHKMLGISALTTAVLFRDGKRSYETFNQKAGYIFNNEEREQWFNSAVRTLECTKNMMGVKVYSILRTYGPQVFIDHFTTCYDLGREFAAIISQGADFELPYEPESNIVCYRYIGSGKTDHELNRLNADIRRKIIESGKFYIVQTQIDNKTYLRSSLMNPFTSKSDMEELLEEIRMYGKSG
ncbi:MAG: pyridoxal-dependent decarboxylase [Porphyromonadaceae bacterium]|nr:MAG: pyridoxal-dependent decarboxylase [Porphyromonadaceae bacterium]